jgi:hypothetical protein
MEVICEHSGSILAHLVSVVNSRKSVYKRALPGRSGSGFPTLAVPQGLLSGPAAILTCPSASDINNALRISYSSCFIPFLLHSRRGCSPE